MASRKEGLASRSLMLGRVRSQEGIPPRSRSAPMYGPGLRIAMSPWSAMSCMKCATSSSSSKW